MKRLIPALLLICSSPAFAKTTLYSWTGVVSNADWKLSVGDTVHGTLQIDDSIPTFDDVGNARYYNSAALLTFQAGGESFSRASGCDWRVSDTGQGVGSAPMVSETTAGDVDWAVYSPTQDLSLAEADNLDGKTGSWGADVWDNITQKERNFWGQILTIQKDQPMAGVLSTDGPSTDGPSNDAAPTPEPSSLVLMASALAALALFGRKQRIPRLKEDSPS